MVEDLGDEVQPEGTLGMDKYRDKWKARADERDDFPTGYFASLDGTQVVLWIVSNGAGMGGASDEKLLEQVKEAAFALQPASFHPAMKIGFGGDIANAKAEKDSLISEALVATAIAAALILIGIVWFYKSFWAIRSSSFLRCSGLVALRICDGTVRLRQFVGRVPRRDHHW